MSNDKKKKLIFIRKENLCMLNKTVRHSKGNELRCMLVKNVTFSSKCPLFDVLKTKRLSRNIHLEL